MLETGKQTKKKKTRDHNYNTQPGIFDCKAAKILWFVSISVRERFREYFYPKFVYVQEVTVQKQHYIHLYENSEHNSTKNLRLLFQHFTRS